MWKRTIVLMALLLGPASALAARDPWPGSEVLTRLFVLRPADGQRLASELRLTPAQVAELRRMAGSERLYGQAARFVRSRGEAGHLNEKLGAMRAEKDRKTRLTLGPSYGDFRVWVRSWWETQVGGARR
ncbi:hypothetical protein SAMN04488058_101152 [Deinococcus reticulitermitis]|uniref:Uncharacterized protein n=1 Tax=Deinococcus reticulitermitis TaxID=856736 RepID=A0A1H6S160_9DEIO|nr:hypothetical protein [Deinococcus reticulitermitis]SEI61898.1 hypothetical protein SAMN04488058_101152 [Deinococcus reticulitermitis]